MIFGWLSAVTARRARTVVSMAPAVLGGCMGLFGDEQQPEPAGERLEVAVGADIVMELEDGTCVEEGVTRCLSDRPVEILSVELEGDAFELGEYRLDSRRELLVDLTARTRGDATLVVIYADFFDREHEDRFALRASEVTRVEATMACDGPVVPESVFPVSAGTSFQVELEAFADERRIETGNLELLADTGALQFDGDSMTAPEQTGTYEVRLIGDDSTPLEVLVYDPQDVELSISEIEIEQFQRYTEGIALLRTIGGTPTCVHEAQTRAWVRVESGDCTPVIGGYALEGEVPLDLTESNAELVLEGSGPCTVQAAVVGGEVGSIDLDLETPYPSPEAWDDVRLTTSPTEVEPALASTHTCREVRDLSRGGCQVVDVGGFSLPTVDCLRSWDWGVSHRDGGQYHDNLPSSYVGVGLFTNLHARIDYDVLGFGLDSYPPSVIDVGVSPQGGLVAYGDGCINDDNASIAVIADAPGTYDLTLAANNINKTDSVTVHARAVGEVVFDTEATDVTVSGLVSTAHFFVGSQTEISIAFEDGSGVPLGGQGSLWARTDDPDARPAIADHPRRLQTGTTPNMIYLENDFTDDEYRVNVVDADAIADVTGLTQPTLVARQRECVTLSALTADGRQIYGRAPERPVLRITDGDVLVVDPDTQLSASTSSSRLCIRGWAPGDATVEMRWGSVERAYEWSVQ